MQGVKVTTKGAHHGWWLRCSGAARSDAGSGWHRVTRIGLLAGSLLLAACGGESADAETDSSANGGGGGSDANPEASTADGAPDAASLAYSECGQGGGGCPASDPICLDIDGVVAAVTGAPAASMLFEACGRACETDSDCPANPETEARPRCVPDTGGTSVCALDCSDGAACPQGMECSHNGQLCLYPHYTAWSGNCATDPSSPVTCVGDCLGQSDVTCTKSCDETEFTCVPDGE